MGGGRLNNNLYFYRELVQTLNQTVGRQAVTVDQLLALIAEAKKIRKMQGPFGLMSFASELPYRFLTHQEVERIQQSPRWYEFSNKMIDLMVQEGVVTPFEATMLKRNV